MDRKLELIVALNYRDELPAMQMVKKLRDKVNFFKIGLPLFTAYGFSLVKKLKQMGLSVFLDLKLHDIPSVVEDTVKIIDKMNVDLLTVHLTGGREMAKSAVNAAKNVKILGVTVLTSITNDDFYGYCGKKIKDSVESLAQIAFDTGMYGIVCSGREAGFVKKQFPSEKVVVPGVRLNKGNAQDQKRIITPQEAHIIGVDYIVVGRPITDSEDPASMVDSFLKSGDIK